MELSEGRPAGNGEHVYPLRVPGCSWGHGAVPGAFEDRIRRLDGVVLARRTVRRPRGASGEPAEDGANASPDVCVMGHGTSPSDEQRPRHRDLLALWRRATRKLQGMLSMQRLGAECCAVIRPLCWSSGCAAGFEHGCSAKRTSARVEPSPGRSPRASPSPPRPGAGTSAPRAVASRCSVARRRHLTANISSGARSPSRCRRRSGTRTSRPTPGAASSATARPRARPRRAPSVPASAPPPRPSRHRAR